LEIGIIKWYNPKGFGSIGVAPDVELFFHIRKNQSLKLYEPGIPVVFNRSFDKVRDRQEAIMMRNVNEHSDWNLIMANLLIDDRVRVSFGHEDAILSVKETALDDLLSSMKESAIANLAIMYFDKELLNKCFILYCDFLSKKIESKFPGDFGKEILLRVWEHVSKNLNSNFLFEIWSRKKFQYINRSDCEDYEIPESILKERWNTLTIDQITRIANYSYGFKFTNSWINDNLERGSFNVADLHKLFKFIKTEPENSKDSMLQIIEEKFVNVWSDHVNLELVNEPSISSERELVKYRLRYINGLPKDFSEEMQKKIDAKLNTILFSKCTNSFLCHLYLNGKVKSIDFQILSSWFADQLFDTSRFAILSKLQLPEQFQLIKDYYAEHGLKNSFKLIYDYHKNRNPQNYISISPTHIYHYFQYEIHSDELIQKWREHILPNLQKSDKIILFKEGFIESLEKDEIIENLSNFSKEDFERISRFYKSDPVFVATLLEEKLNRNDLASIDWLVSIASNYSDKNSLQNFNTLLIEKANPDSYVNLWLRKQVNIRPVIFDKTKIIGHFNIYELFHMTHKSNILNIFKYGLLSHEEAHKGKLNRDISHNQVNDRRKRSDPLFGRSLHSYVPFYFNPKNPMLYRLKAEQNDIIILGIKKDVLFGDELLFTDGNAASASTKFYNSLLDFNKLDWDCIKSDYWSDHEEGKRTRCSEVLIHGTVACSLISTVYTNTEELQDLVKSQLPRDLDIPVCVDNNLFFNKRNYYFNFY